MTKEEFDALPVGARLWELRWESHLPHAVAPVAKADGPTGDDGVGKLFKIIRDAEPGCVTKGYAWYTHLFADEAAARRAAAAWLQDQIDRLRAIQARFTSTAQGEPQADQVDPRDGG